MKAKIKCASILLQVAKKACKVLMWSHSSAPNPLKHASLLLLPALVVHLGHKGVKRQKFLMKFHTHPIKGVPLSNACSNAL